MEAVIMSNTDTELRSASSPSAAASDEADPLDESLSSSGGAAHLNGELNGSSAGEESDPPPTKRVRVSASVGDKAASSNNKDKVLGQKAVSDSSSAKKNTKSPIVVEISSDADSPIKVKTEKINSVKRKLNIKTQVTECDSSGNEEILKKESHRNGDIEAGRSGRGGMDSSEVSLSSESDDTSSKAKNHKVDTSKNGGAFKNTAMDSENKSEDIQEIDLDDNDIEEIKQEKDIEEIKEKKHVEKILQDKDLQKAEKIKQKQDIEEIKQEKDTHKHKSESKSSSEDDPLDLDTKKRNGDEGSSDDKKDDEDSDHKTPSSTPCSSPDKQKINDARRKSAEAKRQALLNITPRRSSRNLNKQKKYIDGEPEPSEEPDIEEILPVDPLAVSASDRVKLSEKDPLAATPEKEVTKVRRKNTIIVNDTKALAQIAANSKEGKKEPTLVIIDTNSILSGRGPVPVSAPPSLPAALPAQGIYPVMHPIPVQRLPTPPKPKGPVGLTDDMYVVEAPSFIVPYVYEKPPKEPLKEVVEKMGKFLREQDKKEREEKQKERKRKEKEREERELKAKEEKKKQQEEKEKQDKLKAEKGEGDKEKEAEKSDEKEAKSEKKDNKEEPMEVDKESPAKKKKKSGEDGPLSDKEDEEEPKADHDSDYKEDENKDKGDSDEDEDVEYDSESDSSTSGSPVAKPKPSSYFESPLGKFFMQIGVNLVQEHVQTDLLRMQKRKLQRGGGSNNPETQLAVQSLLKNLEQSKENNKPYKFQLHKCKFCNFKTESNIVLANHLEIPHLRNFMYHCNFCPVALRTNHDILFHMEAEHNIHGRIERAPAFHQCPNCPFEDNQKSKMTRHALSCTKRFRPERNCEPPMDWEPPAKIPRMAKNRPAVLPGSPTAAQYMAQRVPQGMPQHPLLPKIPAASMMPTLVAGAVRGRGRPAITSRFLPDLKAMPRAIAPSQMRQAGMMYNQSAASRQQLLVPTSYQIAGNQIYQQVVGGQSQMPSMTAMPRLTLMPHSGGSSSSVALVPNLSGGSNSITIQSASSKSPAAKLLQQPSISITPLPRQPSSSNSNSAANFSHPGGKQGQVGGKNSFVICEICDGYIKDLEQLRNHMQWIHKVKIHPKMIYNRPPLNCQKCQFRFFTDQGLERHLLGSHGLVTSSMQEASNKGKDGGRCPVCGRVYQWKLLNHVAKDHNMTLKPAHLSYKCTVCTATFGMYKQFENHVYSAHSVVAKRVMDKKAASNASSSHSRSFSHSSTESLLKPLKINDEITIIPQPAKPSSSSSARGGSHRKTACQADDSGSENSL